MNSEALEPALKTIFLFVALDILTLAAKDVFVRALTSNCRNLKLLRQRSLMTSTGPAGQIQRDENSL